MKVFEIKLKLYLLKDIFYEDVQIEIAKLIDSELAKSEQYGEFHEARQYKNYVFNSLHPCEKEKTYFKDKVYTVVIRTIDQDLAVFFSKRLENSYNRSLKALTAECRILPKKQIKRLYSLTPVILKNDRGYWKQFMEIEDFERRLKENLIKKYKEIMGKELDEDFPFYTMLTFDNRQPVPVKYKNVHLLGDKITMEIAENSQAQDLAYMALGTGVLENNARGFGFMNYRWA